LKNFFYTFLFLFCFASFGKVAALPGNNQLKPGTTKNYKLDKSGKYSDVLNPATSKITKQKRPKKPKGIQVIVPNVSTHTTFHKFYHYSDFSAHEVKGNYSLLLHYSHGKRGTHCHL